MMEKNFTSNCIDEGAFVFENQKVKECIYVNDGESCIMFEILNERQNATKHQPNDGLQKIILVS